MFDRRNNNMLLVVMLLSTLSYLLRVLAILT